MDFRNMEINMDFAKECHPLSPRSQENYGVNKGRQDEKKRKRISLFLTPDPSGYDSHDFYYLRRK